MMCVSKTQRARRVDEEWFISDWTMSETKATSEQLYDWVLKCSDQWMIAFHAAVDWRTANEVWVTIDKQHAPRLVKQINNQFFTCT